MYMHALRIGLEGVVGKRADSPYKSGRSKGWLKCNKQSGARSALTIPALTCCALSV